MPYTQAEIDNIRNITSKLVEDMRPDTPEAHKLRASFIRSPVKVLHERGLPNEVIGHALKQAGFPAAGTPEFDARAHRTNAHRLAGRLIAEGLKNPPADILTDILCTLFHWVGRADRIKAIQLK